MGEFPYECVKCGGAYERCGANCDPADKENGCGGEGGQFCWEDEVVCIVEKFIIHDKTHKEFETLQYIFDKIKNCPITCTYTGCGSVLIHAVNEASDPYTIRVAENKDYVTRTNQMIGRFWCASCYSW